jgi:hypothetical protein
MGIQLNTFDSAWAHPYRCGLKGKRECIGAKNIFPYNKNFKNNKN